MLDKPGAQRQRCEMTDDLRDLLDDLPPLDEVLRETIALTPPDGSPAHEAGAYAVATEAVGRRDAVGVPDDEALRLLMVEVLAIRAVRREFDKLGRHPVRSVMNRASMDVGRLASTHEVPRFKEALRRAVDRRIRLREALRDAGT